MNKSNIHVLYRMFDCDDVLLYVGITNDPKGRFREHAKSQPWWSEVVTIKVQNHQSRELLAYAEQKAIRDEGPLYNVALRPLGEKPPGPRCPTCRAPQPDMVPKDEVLLMEDGTLMPFCTDPYHFPEDPVLAARVHENRELLKQAKLLRLSAEADKRMDRQRAAMEKAFAPLTEALGWTAS